MDPCKFPELSGLAVFPYTSGFIKRELVDQGPVETCRVQLLNVGVFPAVLEMCYQVLFCCDVSFPGVKQNWCVDRFYWLLGRGCGGGTVRTEVWCSDL